VHFTIYMYLYLYSYRRETTRQLRMYAQLTRCFSAVAELLVIYCGRNFVGPISNADWFVGRPFETRVNCANQPGPWRSHRERTVGHMSEWNKNRRQQRWHCM